MMKTQFHVVLTLIASYFLSACAESTLTSKPSIDATREHSEGLEMSEPGFFEDGIPARQSQSESQTTTLATTSLPLDTSKPIPYLKSGHGKCLQVGKEYLITTEVKRNANGTCYENPNFSSKIVALFKQKNKYNVEECFATLWAPVLSVALSETCGSNFTLSHGAVTCNGIDGPGCAWHDQDKRRDFGIFKMHDGGYTQNALLHDTCVAYNFVDPVTFKDLEGYAAANNPVKTIARTPVDSDTFLRRESAGEICADEFAWAIHDVTGISPNVYGWLPTGIDYVLGALAFFNPGRGPADRCNGNFEDDIPSSQKRSHDLESKIMTCTQ